MGKPERAIIQCSVEDVIKILENEPPTGGWLFPHITTAQVMNRVSLAHLSIERTLKFLIYEKGSHAEKIHDLQKLLAELRIHESDAVNFLEEAFQSAVRHYRLKPGAKHMTHFRSLEKYLEETGSRKDFEGIRYWELEPSLDKLLLRRLFLFIHMELLYALHEILIEPDRPKETVGARVRWKVRRTLWEDTGLGLRPGPIEGQPAERYRQWLDEFPSWEDALGDAVQRDFKTDNELVNATTREAYASLLESKDPAVRYFASRLDVIPRQPRDIIPCVEWLGQEENTRGTVKSPGGTIIGWILRGPDGIWHTMLLRTGPQEEPAKANSKTDALCYATNLMSRRAWVTTDGERRELRIVGEERHQFQQAGDRPNSSKEEASVTDRTSVFRVAFWDANQGMEPNKSITIEVPRVNQGNVPPTIQFTDVLEGRIEATLGAEVTVEGHVFTRIDKIPGENREQ